MQGAPSGPGSVCTKCHRNLLELRNSLSVDQLRGSASLCSVPGCPLVKDVRGFRSEHEVSGRELLGPSPPSVFVGRFGYPKVHVGPLLPPAYDQDAQPLDDPRAWLDKGILDVLGMRSQLVRSKAPVNVKKGLDTTKSLDVSRELAMAANPVDTELTLTKRSHLNWERGPSLDQHAAPTGPSVTAEQARLTENPSVPRKVDAIVSDTDAKAAVGARELFDAGISPYHVQRILSVGLLGEEQRRRLVPTRWSITATDDMLGKALTDEARDRHPVNNAEVYHHTHFGNRFWVLLFPRVWSFEMLESWEKDPGQWVTIRDEEPYDGRTSYADDVTGAYYAARLAVLEHLRERNRQAAVLVYREITSAYFAPLGVWVIREGVRRAMEKGPTTFGTREEAVEHVTKRAGVPTWAGESKLLERLRTQTSLEEFL